MEVKVGTVFVTEYKRMWSGPGFEGKQFHVERVLCHVVEVSEHRADYYAVKLLAESGRPPGVAPTRLPEWGGFALDAVGRSFKVELPTAADLEGATFDDPNVARSPWAGRENKKARKARRTS